MIQRQPLWSLLTLLMLGMIVLSACGDAASGADRLPALPPTVTAVPPSTPTELPPHDPIQLAPVNWDEIEHFRAAMRPAFAGDIDAFVNRNRYYIEASLTFEDGVAIIYGAQRVRYTNRSADTLNELVFRLYPNIPALGGRMVVYQAELNDIPVAPSLSERETVLIIPLDKPLAPGDSAEVELQFSTAAERGMFASYGAFGFQDQTFSGPEWYPVLSVYEEGRGWWTERPTPNGDAAYTESGLYEVLLTVPESFVVAMSGSEIERFPAGDEQMTYHYVTGPMRDLLLVASPIFGKLTNVVDDEITVNVFFWPGGESAAEEVLRITSDAVHIFSEKFGTYPYAELDVAETFNYTAIEYPGIIVVSDRSWVRGNTFLEIATAHEVGHQWFYGLIGNNQVQQPWIDESMTSFTEYVYLRELYGEKRFKDTVQGDRDWYNYYKSSGAPDLVLDLPVASYSDNNYGVIIYTKGPLFYFELEKLLGQERFLKAVQLYFQRFRYEVARSNDVLTAFEDATDEDLDAIFYQWVGEFDGLDPAVVEEMKTRP
ncbi:MAG: M1 family metallopeptidase [Chloroflexi bacterium]|nr:M1 family metallopeptidase [Chloroflexota bacterium]